MKSDRCPVPSPASGEPAPGGASLSEDRRRLAELLGRLLARRWLRDRATPGSSDPFRPEGSGPPLPVATGGIRRP